MLEETIKARDNGLSFAFLCGNSLLFDINLFDSFLGQPGRVFSRKALLDGEVNECLCINRGKDPTGLFNEVIGAIDSEGGANNKALSQVGCWYTPCSAGTNQLIPLQNNLTQPIYYPTDCPNVCEIINNIKGKISNTTITENIQCNAVGPPSPTLTPWLTARK